MNRKHSRIYRIVLSYEGAFVERSLTTYHGHARSVPEAARRALAVARRGGLYRPRVQSAEEFCTLTWCH